MHARGPPQRPAARERIEDLKSILNLDEDELDGLAELSEDDQLGSLTLMAKMPMFKKKIRLH